ncbi:MAG TPA: amidohydrolase family protein [Spirochaetota bacterium]|nr:amidohydrolase family protein [Spirochaetota bacterium]
MTIDFHTHIFPRDVLAARDLYMDDPGFKLLYSSEKSVVTDHAGLAEYISANGLSGAAAMSFPWNVEKHCLRQNEYMASLIGSICVFPFGMIPLTRSKSVRAYVEEIKNSALYGIGEIAFYNGGMTDSNIRFLREVLEAAAEFSLPVCLHVNEPVGHQYPGKYEPSLAAVYELLKSVPGATVILAHWGGGLFFYELMPEAHEVLKTVYYDTAATPYLYRSDIYSSAIKIVGAEKIIFGSDYPLLGISRYRRSIEDEVLSVEDREKIFGKNVQRLLFIS